MNEEIFVIIPCFNEARVIRNTVKSVLEKNYSVVIVDDASEDGTKEELRGLPVFYLKHCINMGQGAALQTGINFAKQNGAAYFVTFDADGQHDANDIDRMLEHLRNQNADIIFGSRFLPGAKTNISRSRGFVLNIARYINYLVSGILLSDAHNGLRVFTKTAADKLQLKENKMAHATEFQVLVAKNGLKYDEFPNNILYSQYSKNKGSKNRDSLKIVFEILLNKIFD